MNTENKPLGARLPEEKPYVEKYPIRAMGIEDVGNVETTLRLPYWHWTHDQGKEGACVGFASSMMLAILNSRQARIDRTPPFVRRYNNVWLWNEAKKIDEWEDTNPGDNEGTSVDAAMSILRDHGHQRIRRGVVNPTDIEEGIKENRWATTIDQMRATIAKKLPITIGINWYKGFDAENLVKKGREYYISKKEPDLGYIRGGHSVCVYGVSDRREAFKIKNSWGRDYPLVWMPYSVMERLLKEDGEATIVTDR